MPQLQHLHLRYLRLISDVSINAIASGLPSLSFLDLCFCSLVTPPSLRNLLELRKFTLTELRLCACTQIDDRGLKQLTGAITRESVINMLDVRQCSEAAIANDVVHILMSAPLLFDQAVPALFARPARWNDDVRMRLVEHILSLGD